MKGIPNLAEGKERRNDRALLLQEEMRIDRIETHAAQEKGRRLGRWRSKRFW